LADMNDETRAAGKQGEGHHGHIRLALVQGAEGCHLLGSQQFAERLGVGGIHRWGVVIELLNSSLLVTKQGGSGRSQSSGQKEVSKALAS